MAAKPLPPLLKNLDLQPGEIIYSVVYGKSGTRSLYNLFAIRDNRAHRITGVVANLLDLPYDQGREVIKTSAGPEDVVWHLSCAIFGPDNGSALVQERLA